MRQKLAFALGLLVTVAACTDESASPLEPVESVETTVAEGRYEITPVYSISVTNLTSGQPFTPPVIATHSRSLRLWRTGRRASEGVRQIAENGDLAPMLGSLGESSAVNEFLVAEGPSIPPVLPGETVTIDIEGSRRARYFSVISMLICTNDGFAGVTRTRLPSRVGQTRTLRARAYDAGTEINTGDFEEIVPPCAPLTGVETVKQGSGMSNPELFENGRVRRHRGIRGAEDLIPEIHGWRGPVAKIEVTRVR